MPQQAGGDGAARDRERRGPLQRGRRRHRPSVPRRGQSPRRPRNAARARRLAPTSALRGADCYRDLQIVSFWETGRDGEVGREPDTFDDAQLRASLETAIAERAIYLGPRDLGRIGRKHEEATGDQHACGGSSEVGEVAGDGEVTGRTLRERRGIADDEVEAAAARGELIERLHGVGGDGLELRRIEAGELVIAARAGVYLCRGV